jgi:hypothetical protein
MAGTTSRSQVVFGVAFGILLQPVSVMMVIAYINATAHGEGRGWGLMAAYLLYWSYFGMAQALTILPAALVMLSFGRHGVVRGLLYVGTTLALLNAAVLAVEYPLLRLVY